jgi:hypothetical protein
MKRLILLLVITATFLFCSVRAEEVLMLQTTQTVPKYELITNISLGPFGYEKKGETEITYRYRIIISTFEIYDDLFIEKLKITGEEDIPDGIDWSRMLDLKPILEKLKISTEQQNISKIEWLSPTSLRFRLGGKPIVLEDIRQPKIKAKTN